MIESSCHCGTVKLEILSAPEEVTDCNCSICRRYGVLWAYYSPAHVRIAATQGATEGYRWGDQSIEFHRCQNCGCVTHWAAVGQPADRMGVNARLMAPEVLAAARTRRLDGADTWKYLDECQPIYPEVAMPADFPTAAIEAVSAPARAPLLSFPEPLASLMKDRIRHPLGTHFGITHFGVNLTYLPPGSVSAPRHSHSHQDEFVYILEGTPILVTSAGETPLRPGMCAGFKAGSDDAHQLRNRSDGMAVYLEIGDRTAGDAVTYADDDIKIEKMPDGRLQVVRKDGSPY